MKKFYVFAWFLLVAAVIATALTDNFNGAAQVVFSLVALALVYALALWSVFTNARDMKTE